MKLLLLTDGIYPLTIGGMQKHSYYLAKFLAREDITLDVVIPAFDQRKVDKIDEHLINQEKENLTFFEVDKCDAIYFPGHYIYESFKYSENIYNRFVDKLQGYDFIYAQGFTAWYLIRERKRAKIKTPPIGVNFHGLEMFQKAGDFISKLEQYLFRYPAKYNIQNADYAYSLGGKLTSILRRVSEGETDILQTPIGIEGYWLDNVNLSINDCKRFVFIGRYEKRKGIKLLNEAIRKNINSDFFFDFVGPIPENKWIKNPKIIYHGQIQDENKIINILDQADVLFCPSYSEGMPTVILEAMARGLAVVATDVGAVSCLVTDQTGWLLKPGDRNGLVETFRECLRMDNNKLLNKKKEAHKLVSENYTWSNIARLNKQKIVTAVK